MKKRYLVFFLIVSISLIGAYLTTGWDFFNPNPETWSPDDPWWSSYYNNTKIFPEESIPHKTGQQYENGTKITTIALYYENGTIVSSEIQTIIVIIVDTTVQQTTDTYLPYNNTLV